MRLGDRWTRFASGVVCAACILITGGLAGRAEARIDVAVGLSGHVVRLHFAPIRVELSGLDAATEGEIVVRQKIGNPLQNPDEIEHVLARETLTNRVYESTIPIYDPLNPLEVSVVEADGSVLAGSVVNVRMNRRTAPFPGVCGFSAAVTEDAVFLDSADLPRDWWGLDELRSLWVGGDCALTSAEWQTVAEWTIAGGSLVVLTGADFYRMDSPVLRRLLPITEPHVETVPGGAVAVVGPLRPGARVMIGSEGSPLLVARQYGAGRVLMVTEAAGDAEPSELAQVGAMVPTARLLSAERISEATLRQIRVVRASYLIAPGIVTATLAGFLWFARRVERRGGLAFGVLIAGIVGVAAWSGFVSNSAKQPVDLYGSSTAISVQEGYGITVGSCSLYAGRARQLDLPRREDGFPIESLVLAAPGASFDAVSDAEETRLRLQTHERRDLEFFGREPVLIEMRVADGVATVENRSGRVIEGAIVLAGGRVHELPPIGAGEQAFELGDGVETYLYEPEHAAVDVVLERFSERLTLSSETWLVLFEEGETVRREGQFGRKVRETEIHLVHGDAT